jgi:hypothetical protein
MNMTNFLVPITWPRQLISRPMVPLFRQCIWLLSSPTTSIIEQCYTLYLYLYLYFYFYFYRDVWFWTKSKVQIKSVFEFVLLYIYIYILYIKLKLEQIWVDVYFNFEWKNIKFTAIAPFVNMLYIGGCFLFIVWKCVHIT